MGLGWTMGESPATASVSANHASANRASRFMRVSVRKVCILEKE